MRIVEVVKTWPAETFICRHIDALSDLEQIGLDLLALSGRSAEPASVDRGSCAGFHARYLPSLSNASLLDKLRFVAKAVSFRPPSGSWGILERVIIREIKRSRPDLLHFHFGYVAVRLAGYVTALGLPYTLSIRGSDIRVRPLLDAQYAASLKHVLASASRIHVVCDALGDAVQRLCPGLNDIETIRTCVPIPCDIHPSNQDTKRLTFVSIGRLHWTKAYDDLIRAMSLIQDANLIIIGDGPDYEYLLFLIEELGLRGKVRLAGRLSQNSISAVLNNATAYVQTSITEGFSNAVAEAMAHGKLVFATAVGGTGEVIIDGVNGVLLPTGDPIGIAQRLELAKDPQVRRELGEAARQTAQQLFTPKLHATKFINFFEKAVHHN